MKKVFFLCFLILFSLSSISFGKGSLEKYNFSDKDILSIRTLLIPYMMKKQSKDELKHKLISFLNKKHSNIDDCISQKLEAKKYLESNNVKKIGSFNYNGSCISNYYDDSDFIYYNNERISKDVENFKYLGGIYAKDKKNVYFGSDILSDADTKSFEYLGGSFGKDKYNLYIGGEKNFWIKVDFDTLEVLEKTNIFFDKNGIYDGLDAYLFKNKNGYKIFKNRTTSIALLSRLFQYKNLDKEKDMIEKELLEKVKNNTLGGKEVVYNYLPSVDTSEILTPVSFLGNDNTYAKGILENMIYSVGIVIEGADFDSFEVISSFHAKDKSNCYYNETRIKGCDLETFKDMEYGFAKDKNKNYFRGKVWEGKVLNGEELNEYLKNKKN